MLTVEKSKKFDWKNIPLEECLVGNALDAHYTAKIYHHLLEELQSKKLEKLYEYLIAPATAIFAEMEFDGLLIDQEKLETLKYEISKKMYNLSLDLLSCNYLPDDPNFNSNTDLVKILFSIEKDDNGDWQVSETIGFGLYPFSKTDKGQPQTNEETLVKVKEMVDREYKERFGDEEKE